MEDFKIKLNSKMDIEIILAHLESNGVKWISGDGVYHLREKLKIGRWVFVRKNKASWWFDDEGCNLPEKSIDDFQLETIIFTKVGKRTLGFHTKDGKVQSTAIAKCHPDDGFNFKIGCKTALDRLYENKIQKGDYVQVRGDLTDEEIKKYMLFPSIYQEMQGNIYHVNHAYSDGNVCINGYIVTSEVVHKVKLVRRKANEGEYVQLMWGLGPFKVQKIFASDMNVFNGKEIVTISNGNHSVIEGYVEYQKELHILNIHGVDVGKVGEPAGFDDAVGRKLHIGDEVIMYEDGDDRGAGILQMGKSGITVLPYKREAFLDGYFKVVLKKSHTELKNGDIASFGRYNIVEL